ncbi:MAG: flagellar hook-length control protein FliK [Undibacterium sp.]|uniref:flagellar hook-length control protein FliK n=1 Tax=Undibacterium sp. TaxID=1914977 RepID=UPI0027191D57|nr:flagellar hook-length control protein FliK [Undibacterium sp.]MDO8651600.1 flagellar hook-length control protein FliK [Undibacterium sp.]
MLPRVDTTHRPIATIESPSTGASIGATKQEVASKLGQLVVGKSIRGEILSRLDDGTFFVKLAGVTARMALPQNTKVGDSIPLTLVALTPRPTFLLEGAQSNTTTTAVFSRQDLIDSFLQNTSKENSSSSAATSKLISSDLLATGSDRAELVSLQQVIGVDGKSTTVSPNDLAGLSTSTSLSNAGKLIDSLLKEAQQQGAANALVGKTALVQIGEELLHPGKLAAHLQQTISSSGLFYEAHIADWAAGKLTLSDLMREPQAQNAHAAILNSNTAAGEGLSNMAQMIHLQLDALEQQRIAWQGKLLPDLPMEWEIRRDGRRAQDDENDDESTSSWQSTVRFELPQLGVVAATINMHAGHLQLLLRTDTAETVNSLQKHASVLADALKQTGSSLDSFSVKQDDEA